jgi:hypothetical protein
LLRIAVLVVGVLAQVPVHDLVYLAPSASGLVVLLVVWLTMFDARRLGEVLFLADLGVSPGVLAVVALTPPALGELAVTLVGAW